MSEFNIGKPSSEDEQARSPFERTSEDRENEEEEKAKKARKKKREEARKKSESETEKPAGEKAKAEDKDKERKRGSFLNGLLDVDQDAESSSSTDKKAEKATDKKTEKAEKDLPPAEVLSADETIDAVETYIDRRNAQLAAEQEAATEQDKPDESEEEALAAQANSRFLAALRQKLRLQKRAPDAEVYEAALAEAASDSSHATEEAKGEGAPVDTEVPSPPLLDETKAENPAESTAVPAEAPPYPDLVVPLDLDTGQTARVKETPYTPFKNPFQPPPASDRESFEPTERKSTAAGAGATLLGGFIGYLVGKRRGKNKTEQEMEPIQRSLEKQVGELEQTIRGYEERSRIIAQEKAHVNQPEAALPLTRNETSAKVVSAEAAPADTIKPEFSPAPDKKTAAVERVGALAATKEVYAPRAETRIPELTAAVDVDTAPKTEVLKAAARIEHKGTTVRRLHEEGKLNERSVRTILKEHLRGNQVEQLIAKELSIVSATEAFNPETSPGEAQGDLAAAGAVQATPEVVTSSPDKSYSNDVADNAALPQNNQNIAPEHTNRPGREEAKRQVATGALIGIVLVVIFLIFFYR